MPKDKTQKVLILVTHSLGEFDVLFPLISAIEKKNHVNIEIIVAVKHIYEQFLGNDFYKSCIKKFDCKISYQNLPNKFNKEFREFKDYFLGNSLLKIYFFLMSVVVFPRLMKKIIFSDICMHEFSNQLDSTRPLYWAHSILGKRIITYSHGHSFTLDTRVLKKKNYANRSLFLVFHENDSHYMRQLGYTNQYIIGYPKFYPEWKKMLLEYTGSLFKRDKIALVYSRHIHTFYMDKEKYKYLIISTCETIREKFGDILIVFKPHPRESQEEIEQIVESGGFNNVVVSWEHSGVLARNAQIAVSFWTSAILDSLSLGVPSVEYYIEADRFREIEPEGSAYKKLGIDSVDNRKDLEFFFDLVLNNLYQIPEFIKKIDNVQDIGFIDTN